MAQDDAEDKDAQSPSSSSSSPDALLPTSVWPEKSLVGMTGEQAKLEIILHGSTNNSGLEDSNVHIVPQDSMVTMDYNLNRVRIFVDEDGRVVSQPQRG